MSDDAKRLEAKALRIHNKIEHMEADINKLRKEYWMAVRDAQKAATRSTTLSRTIKRSLRGE